VTDDNLAEAIGLSEGNLLTNLPIRRTSREAWRIDPGKFSPRQLAGKRPASVRESTRAEPPGSDPRARGAWAMGYGRDRKGGEKPQQMPTKLTLEIVAAAILGFRGTEAAYRR